MKENEVTLNHFTSCYPVEHSFNHESYGILQKPYYESRNNNLRLVINSENVKKEILEDLHERWERETEGKVVFMSAIEKRNLDLLRKTILDRVREVYKVRYPYKTEFLY